MILELDLQTSLVHCLYKDLEGDDCSSCASGNIYGRAPPTIQSVTACTYTQIEQSGIYPGLTYLISTWYTRGT